MMLVKYSLERLRVPIGNGRCNVQNAKMTVPEGTAQSDREEVPNLTEDLPIGQ